ncbi:MAG TPA: hypothetical protein VNC78_05155 [Actinomycetota bacterium]|nr:hypothetical protein [Actinomycetota bacterium]
METLRDHYRDRWGLDVRILQVMTVEETAQLPSGQLDAYDLAYQLQRAYEAEVAPVAVIGFTTHDLNQEDLNFVYGANIAGGYASISTARMDPTPGDPPDEVLLMERLRKFTTRYIAFTYFDLPLSGNPSSVLSPLSGTHDLDKQGEFPCPSAPFEMASC